MTKVLMKVNNKVMATDGKLVTGEKQEGSLLKPVLDATKSMAHWFTNYQGESVDHLINYNDTENVTSIYYTFSNCSNLQSIEIDTSNVTSMGYAFTSATNLLKIDISHFNISSTSNTSSSFVYCRKLKALIIRSFGTSYVLNSNAFDNCYRMLHIANATYNPNNEHDGYVYAPRDMITTLQSETNWSNLYFRALEDYTDDGTTTGKFLDEKAGL